MSRIYLTYCAKKKNDTYKETGEKVLPCELYTSERIQAFMTVCKTKGVQWAIFSDKYGVWHPHIKHEWYEKSPDDVTHDEFVLLLKEFNESLSDYLEIVFCYPQDDKLPALYDCLLKETDLKERIKIIKDVAEIT